jgi:hypothetical protein
MLKRKIVDFHAPVKLGRERPVLSKLLVSQPADRRPFTDPVHELRRVNSQGNFSRQIRLFQRRSDYSGFGRRN